MKMGDGTLNWADGERCEPNLRPVVSLATDQLSSAAGGGWTYNELVTIQSLAVGAGAGAAFRFTADVIFDNLNYRNLASPYKDVMLMGCHHYLEDVATDSSFYPFDKGKYPRLAQPKIGW